jgi:hypothetical protein
MMPDVKKETQTGWLVLGGTMVVVLIAFWVISDGGALAEQAGQEKDRHAKGGSEDMLAHVDRQIEANQAMRLTIENLKRDSSFVLAKEFLIPADAKQPGYLFKQRFTEVREGLRNKAEAKKISYDQNIGFGADPKVPDDREAPYLMSMLQLTEKVVAIAFGTPTPLENLKVSHLDAVNTGPESRPVLVREYPLKLEVRGGLKDILWVLHRISQVTPTADGKTKDYPLILRGFSIKSDNAKAKDSVQQLDAVFDLAAMHFITEEERANDPLAFQPVSSGGTRASPRATNGGGKPVFHARP